MAERQLPKLNVAGSIPVSRSMCFQQFAETITHSFHFALHSGWQCYLHRTSWAPEASWVDFRMFCLLEFVKPVARERRFISDSLIASPANASGSPQTALS